MKIVLTLLAVTIFLAYLLCQKKIVSMMRYNFVYGSLADVTANAGDQEPATVDPRHWPMLQPMQGPRSHRRPPPIAGRCYSKCRRSGATIDPPTSAIAR